MFSQTARYYDRLYSWKDYRAEAEQVIQIVRKHLRSGGRALLDVACGTGAHLQYLQEHFRCEGLDLDEGMLQVARERLPGMALHRADMVDFDLGRDFDVVTCLFSSIGYVKTIERLNRALACMARHLVPGGVCIIEPWFTPETWHTGTVHAAFVDEPALKIARINTSLADGSLSYFDFHYLIGTPEKTEYVVERHELGLFTVEDMRVAFLQAGLEVTYDPQGFEMMRRGLFIGTRASTE